MKYITVLIMCCLATAKVSLQSTFSKKSVNNTTDSIFFNGIVFAFASILFLPDIHMRSMEIWMYATLFATFTVLFQMSYVKALSIGNVSLTVLFVNLSMVIPVLVSFFVYKEPLTVMRLLAVILTIIAFIISVDYKSSAKADKKWFLHTFLAMLSNGGIAVVQKIFGATDLKSETQMFVSCSYIVATIITLILYLLIKKDGKYKTFKTDKNVILLALLIGIVLAVFQAVNTYAISTIEGTFLFPAYSGGSIIFSVISGRLFFKDKLIVKQKISIFIGIIAIVIMNF